MIKIPTHIWGAAGLVCVGLAVAAIVNMKHNAFQAGYDKAKSEVATVTQAAHDANEKRAHSVVIQEVERVVYVDKYITKIQKEIEYVTQPLAVCPLPDDSVRLWNDITDCLFSSEAAACRVDERVSAP